MKDKFFTFAKFAFVGFLIFIFLKSCVKETFSFDQKLEYKKVYKDGRVNKIFILPPNRFIFSKRIGNYYESGLFHVLGSNATHYFGPIYNVGNSPLGLRLYSHAQGVWNAEIQLKAKKGNLTQSTFGNKGRTYRNILIVYPNSINIYGKSYKKVKLNMDEYQRQKRLLGIK